jgi:hydrogenase maturation factor HypF (carbamoyltransferase family)
VLLRKVLRQALQAFVEQRGLRGADLAVHQHQQFARAAEAATEVVSTACVAEVLHHRAHRAASGRSCRS